jgi:hypothetical protein
MRAFIVLHGDVTPLLEWIAKSLSFPKQCAWIVGIEMCSAAVADI